MTNTPPDPSNLPVPPAPGGGNLAEVLAQLEIAALFVDRGLRVRWFTPATAELLDWSPSDAGQPLRDAASKFIDPDLLRDVRQVLAAGERLEKEIRHGARIYFRRILPQRALDGRVDGAVLAFGEITRLKQTEDSLRAAQHDAEAARNQFITEVSHELRTPLMPMMLWVQILGHEAMPEPALLREGLEMIRKCAEEQHALLEKLVERSRNRATAGESHPAKTNAG